jgi:hypothetical protein
MRHIHTFESFLSEANASSSTLTVYLTNAAADSMKRDLIANGVKFKEITPTRFEMEETAKARLAIKLVKERFGTRAIKVEGLSESDSNNEAYQNIPGNMKIAGKYEVTIKGKTIETQVAGFEKQDSSSDSLYLMDNDPLKDEHGSFIVKNNDMPKLSKGTVVNGECSKHGIPVKLKRIGDL